MNSSVEAAAELTEAMRVWNVKRLAFSDQLFDVIDIVKRVIVNKTLTPSEVIAITGMPITLLRKLTVLEPMAMPDEEVDLELAFQVDISYVVTKKDE